MSENHFPANFRRKLSASRKAAPRKSRFHPAIRNHFPAPRPTPHVGAVVLQALLRPAEVSTWPTPRPRECVARPRSAHHSRHACRAVQCAMVEADVTKKIAEIEATRLGSAKARREALLEFKQTEVSEQQAKVMVCQKEYDALVNKEALKVQAASGMRFGGRAAEQYGASIIDLADPRASAGAGGCRRRSGRLESCRLHDTPAVTDIMCRWPRMVLRVSPVLPQVRAGRRPAWHGTWATWRPVCGRWLRPLVAVLAPSATPSSTRLVLV